MKTKKFTTLILSLIISLGTGALSALITRNNMNIYEFFAKPPLAPPAWLFPVVWTILYTLMGISAYLVAVSDSKYKGPALFTYALQLIVNFFWSIIFFNGNRFLFAFIWIILLIVLVIFMIADFYKVNKTAAFLQIPYLLWITFASYLNLGIYLLNK